jgi:hypothetical protein
VYANNAEAVDDTNRCKPNDDNPGTSIPGAQLSAHMPYYYFYVRAFRAALSRASPKFVANLSMCRSMNASYTVSTITPARPIDKHMSLPLILCHIALALLASIIITIAAHVDYTANSMSTVSGKILP